jgi:hypothetical protein
MELASLVEKLGEIIMVILAEAGIRSTLLNLRWN